MGLITLSHFAWFRHDVLVQSSYSTHKITIFYTCGYFHKMDMDELVVHSWPRCEALARLVGLLHSRTFCEDLFVFKALFCTVSIHQHLPAIFNSVSIYQQEIQPIFGFLYLNWIFSQCSNLRFQNYIEDENGERWDYGTPVDSDEFRYVQI